jgi:riboflavin kinase/FMN adenylyltransferase
LSTGASPRTAVAVGVFDGLHLGHQAILRAALDRAAGGRCVVISFDPHPDVVLAKHFQAVAPLTPLSEKRRRLAAMGIGELEVVPFTRELASMEPEAFVETYLVTPHRLAALVVGEGFALGRGRSGNCERLRAIGRTHGFEVDEVPLLEVAGARVSSTRIRTLLAEGRVAEVAPLLGRLYTLEAKVVTGEAIGRTLGFPTANLRLHEEKLVPGNGIYAVRARIDGETQSLPGAMSIGVRPTFGGQMRTLEVFLLDWSGDLVGRSMEVELVDWIRPELKFDSKEALIAAMEEDVAQVRRRLAG